MSYPRSLAVLLMLCLLAFTSAQAAPAKAPAASIEQALASPTWPQVLTSSDTRLTIYQPQLDSWDGYTLQARATVEARGNDGKSTYGIAQFSAHTLVDKASRWVALDQYTITKADFPSSAAQADTWVATLRKDAASRKKAISLDQLEAAVGVLTAEQKSSKEPIENTPPSIITSDVPALLVYIDGEPAYRPVDRTALQRVINTRPLLLKDAQDKHYLHVFDGWMKADELSGQYAPLPSPSADLEKARKAAIQSRQVDLLTGQSDPKDRVNPANSAQVQNLNRESAACSLGNQRLNNYHDSSRVMIARLPGGADCIDVEGGAHHPKTRLVLRQSLLIQNPLYRPCPVFTPENPSNEPMARHPHS